MNVSTIVSGIIKGHFSLYVTGSTRNITDNPSRLTLELDIGVLTVRQDKWDLSDACLLLEGARRLMLSTPSVLLDLTKISHVIDYEAVIEISGSGHWSGDMLSWRNMNAAWNTQISDCGSLAANLLWVEAGVYKLETDAPVIAGDTYFERMNRHLALKWDECLESKAEAIAKIQAKPCNERTLKDWDCLNQWNQMIEHIESLASHDFLNLLNTTCQASNPIQPDNKLTPVVAHMVRAANRSRDLGNRDLYAQQVEICHSWEPLIHETRWRLAIDSAGDGFSAPDTWWANSEETEILNRLQSDARMHSVEPAAEPTRRPKKHRSKTKPKGFASTKPNTKS